MIFCVILFLISFGLAYFDWREVSSLCDKPVTLNRWMMLISIVELVVGLITLEWYLAIFSAFGVLYFVFAHKIYRVWLFNEAEIWMRETEVETWFFDSESGYWHRSSNQVSLYEWIDEHERGFECYDLVRLRLYGQKYHWIYFDRPGNLEIPRPECCHYEYSLRQMYAPDRLGPYG
jgi:hypothetical protein